MKVIIDADACPVTKLAVEESKKRNIPVLCICDTSHVITSDYASVHIVDKGRDSADLAVVSACSRNDVVITQDFGVASMALAKGAFCINQNGLRYTESNIDSLMAMRHAAMQERRKNSRHHLKGPKKRTADDDKSFLVSFTSVLDSLIQ